MPRRCPCWPQQEPFDAAEVNVLRIAKTLAGLLSACIWSEDVWEALHTSCETLPRHRVAYVLSTFVYADDRVSFTLLWLVSHRFYEAQWLLQQGVCPNMDCYRGTAFKGWQRGSAHPGRPPAWGRITHAPLQTCRPDLVGQLKTAALFLGYGAYPTHPRASFAPARRQWHQWHARMSRRQWVACALRTIPERNDEF